MIYIYKISFIGTNKVYIGKSISPHKRWIRHKCDSKKCNSKLYRAMRKYGICNTVFEIIATCLPSDINGNESEKLLIKQYDSYHNGYNSTLGGDGGRYNIKPWNYGKSIPQHTKEKISTSLRGKNNHFYGKKHSDKAKKLMSVKKKGTYIGSNNPNYGNKGVKNPNSKKYKITKKDGTSIEIVGLHEWAKMNAYDASCLGKMANKNRKQHKDIISVEILTR